MSIDSDVEGGVCACMCEGRSDQWRFPLPASAQHSSRWEGVWASVMTHTHNELACCAVQYKTGKRKYNSNTNSKVRKPLPSMWT